MRFRVKNIALSVIIILLTVAVGLAAMDSPRFFSRGREVNISTIVRDGEIYVSLKDMARHFPGVIHVDQAGNRININPDDGESSPEDFTPAEIPAGAIRGRVLLKGSSGVEFPRRNISVALHLQNQSISDSDALSAYRSYALGDDTQYAMTHGRVREGRTDAGGNFFLAGVPPGKYEIVALEPSAEGRTGRFWRKRILIDKGDVPVLILDNRYCYSLD